MGDLSAMHGPTPDDPQVPIRRSGLFSIRGNDVVEQARAQQGELNLE
jgi:hypothetical protein